MLPCEAALVEKLEGLELIDKQFYLAGCQGHIIFKYYEFTGVLQYSHYDIGILLEGYSKAELNEFLKYFFAKYYKINITRLQSWYNTI